MAKAKVTGGKKVKEHIQRQKTADSVKGVAVGFFASARYPDGTPVTNVAAWNEFGTKASAQRPFDIPERPFMRPVAQEERENVRNLLRRLVDTDALKVTRSDAGIIGKYLKGQIQAKIVAVNEPPNAPSTIERKRSSNPLIDTSFMRLATTYKIV